jgi:hypothetical protein
VKRSFSNLFSSFSPIKHSDNGKVSVAVYHNDRQLYLHGICLECLSMRSLHVHCRLCKMKFNFDPIIFGTLYYYGMSVNILLAKYVLLLFSFLFKIYLQHSHVVNQDYHVRNVFNQLYQ